MSTSPVSNETPQREVSGPRLELTGAPANAVKVLERRASNTPDAPMVSTRVGNHFVDRSSAVVWKRVRDLAKGLIASGVKPGDRVALMSGTRVEWLELDLAINAAGAVTVPIYDTSSASQIGWILQDSGAVALFVENDLMRHEATGEEEANECQEVFVIDDGLNDLVHRGSAVPDDELDVRVGDLNAASIATIIYTSGTTGRPKGCVLTHGNLTMNVAQVTDALGDSVDSSDSGLIFLPLAHVLTKITVLFCLSSGVRIMFATSITKLPEEFALANPTLISAVPRIFEKVYAKSQQTAVAAGKGKIFEVAASAAIRWSEQRAAGRVRPLTAVEHWVFDRLVYRKIADAFGGELRMAFSGGGPLGARLTSFFDGIGLRIYEGYGLTETSPILTISRTDAWRPGSVGPAVAGTDLTFAEDGEILAKGPQVFQGYWHNDAATDEVFDSAGWFHTGDVGTADADGYVHITGRKKEMIVTAAGKNVAPAPLEDQIRAHRLVSQAVVVGDRRPFIGALISIDEESFADWAAEHHFDGRTVADLASSKTLRAEIQEAIDAANRSVSKAESIREFVIMPQDLEVSRGEMTPTLKVRRMVVEDHYSDLIDSIYA